MAQVESFTVPEGKAIYYLWLDIPMDSSGTFSVTLGNNDILSGSWSYSPSWYGAAKDLSVTFDGITESDTYVFPRNTRITIGMGAGDRKNITLNADSISIDTVGGAPIIGYIVSSEQTIGIDYNLMDYTVAGKYVNTVDTDFLERLRGWLESFWYIFAGGIFWADFLFVKNGLTIICLYLVMTAAVAYNQSRDIFHAHKKWISQQRAIFEFIIGVFKTILDIAATVINALKPV